MDISSWTKLAVVVIVCAAAIILGYAGKLDSQAVVALLSASLGYVFGNAHGVISAISSQNAQSLNKGNGTSGSSSPPQNPPDALKE
ncbi:MAG: hypothetical protein QXP27_07485 [Candidatus Methanomethyliaceae archaeon]